MTEKVLQRRLRYGEFLSAVRVKQRRVSYKEVHADAGRRPRMQRLRLVDLHRLLTPYVSLRFMEQLRAVVPLALFLALFQIAALRADVLQGELIAFGMLAVMLGLMFFMDGVKYGLMPFSENIGFNLPNRATPAVVLGFAFLLGGIATLAEPAIGALRAAGSSVDPIRAPWLHLLLTRYPDRLVMAVGLGVGLAVVVGMLRFFFAWRMKTLVIATLLPCLALDGLCRIRSASGADHRSGVGLRRHHHRAGDRAPGAGAGHWRRRGSGPGGQSAGGIRHRHPGFACFRPSR